MTLRLTVLNFDSLEDGGPVTYTVNQRGFVIGRAPYIDWTLPDAQRLVSSKHCEVRFRDGGYWLHDLSTNGAFLNESPIRMPAPHKLQNGDRISIGPYVIGVELAGAATNARRPEAPTAFGGVAAWENFAAEPAPVNPTPGRAAKPQDPGWIDPPPLSALPRLAPQEQAWAAPNGVKLRPPPAPATFPSSSADDADCAKGGPSRAPAPPIAGAPSAEEAILARIAQTAGLKPSALQAGSAGETADAIGAVLRLTAERLAAMLRARDETRREMRSRLGGFGVNRPLNPLEALPETSEAMKAMFGAGGDRYLDAEAAVDRSFHDIATHQTLVFAAMRESLELLFSELAPDRIEGASHSDRGVGPRAPASRKAQLWDRYVDRWRVVSRRTDGRLSEAFWELMGDAYDRLEGEAD